MRYSFAPLFFLLALPGSALTAVNFSGSWTLDLRASDSPDSMMKRMGVPWIERKLAASTKLEATYHQTRDVLTVTSRAPGFSRVETFHFDGRTETKNEKRTGAYTIRTAWSNDHQQLISTSHFKTRHEKNAKLVVTRQLSNGGKILVLTETLKIEGEPDGPPIRRVWHRSSES